MKTIEIRMDVAWVPHSFIILDDGTGSPKGYGHGPAEGLSLWGPGVIQDDLEHKWNITTEKIQVTDEQFNIISKFIADSIDNPPYYSVPKSIVNPNGVWQCAQWVADLARQGDVELPFGLPSGGWNPYGQAFWTLLKRPHEVRDFDPTMGLLDLEIDGWMSRNFNAARQWTPGRWRPGLDPFALDLNGDGIATAGDVDSSVLFDHNVDGMLNGTGWLRGSDGFLVRDLNNNGEIDSGAELFGIGTRLPDNSLASDGFEAIAPLDTNTDGAINALDEDFSDLRVWQDINENGISESNELKTLSDLGIESISTAETNNIIGLGNGNLIDGTGTFTRADGTTGTTANLIFAELRAFRQSTDPGAVDEPVRELPNMQGGGAVDDLWQAASSSSSLESALSSYSALTTRAEQQGAIEDLIELWAETSDMPPSQLMAQGLSPYLMIDFTFSEIPSISASQVLENWAAAHTGPGPYELTREQFLAAQTDEYRSWIKRVGILEVFAGQQYFDPIELDTPTQIAYQQAYEEGGDIHYRQSTASSTSVTFSLEQMGMIRRAWGVSGVVNPPENGGEKRIARFRSMHHAQPTPYSPRALPTLSA